MHLQLEFRDDFTETEIHEKIMKGINDKKKGGHETRKLTPEVITDINNRYQKLISEDPPWPITAAKMKIAEDLELGYTSINTATKQGSKAPI